MEARIALMNGPYFAGLTNFPLRVCISSDVDQEIDADWYVDSVFLTKSGEPELCFGFSKLIMRPVGGRTTWLLANQPACAEVDVLKDEELDGLPAGTYQLRATVLVFKKELEDFELVELRDEKEVVVQPR